MTESSMRHYQPVRTLRRYGLPFLVLGGAAALLAACGPDDPAGLNRTGSTAVADAEGNVGVQGTAITPDSWTVTGAYLAGLTAFDARDMGTAADLLTIALGDELKDPGLAQKTLFALLSDSRIADAVALAKRMKEAGFKSALISVALIQDSTRAGKFDAALATARELPDDRLMSVTGPMLRAWLALGANGQQAAAPTANRRRWRS
jgi:hypothetical protein